MKLYDFTTERSRHPVRSAVELAREAKLARRCKTDRERNTNRKGHQP